MTDTEIIDLFFERSEQAIAAVAEKHGAAAAHAARNILGSDQDTEECLNDTYLALWNSIPPNRPFPLRSFVCAVARNLAVKKYHSDTAQKRNSRYDAALDELEDCLSGGCSVEDEIAARELSAAISGFLDTLNYTDRFVFMRRYWYADPLPEIARMTGKSVNSVTVRLFRIREKLRYYLIREGLLV